MKTILTTQLVGDPICFPVAPGRKVDRASMRTSVNLARPPYMASYGTGLSTIGFQVEAVVRPTCADARPLADGHWVDTPKFGDTYHFQRWRCST